MALVGKVFKITKLVSLQSLIYIEVYEIFVVKFSSYVNYGTLYFCVNH